MKKAICLTLGISMFSLAFNGSAQPGSKALTLKECIFYAMKNNLQVAAGVLNPELASLSVSLFKEKFLPKLTFRMENENTREPSFSWIEAAELVRTIYSYYSAGIGQMIPTGGTISATLYGYKNDTNAKFQNINPRYRVTLNLTFSQPLLKDFGLPVARKDILVAQNNQAVSENEFRIVLLETVYDVEESYWNLVYSQEILKVKEQSLRLAQDLLEKNKNEVAIGTLAPKEILGAQAEVAARQADILQAKMQVKNASNQLEILINLPEEGDVLLIPSDRPAFEERKTNFEECLQVALKNRPDLQAGKYDLKNKDLEVGYSRNQLLPALNLEFSYWSPGISGTRLLYDDPLSGIIVGSIPGGVSTAFGDAFRFKHKNWSVGLSLEIPTSNILSRAALARAKVTQDQAIIKMKELEQQSRLEVETAVMSVQTDYERVRAYRIARELAEKKLAAEEAKLKAGLSTNFVVLQYQRDMANASMAELKAIIDYNLSLARLDKSMGTSLQNWNIQVMDVSNKETN